MTAVRSGAAETFPAPVVCLPDGIPAAPASAAVLSAARLEFLARMPPPPRCLVAVEPGAADLAVRPVPSRSRAARIGLVASVALHGAAALAIAWHGLVAPPLALEGPGAPMVVTLISAGSAMPADAIEAPAVAAAPEIAIDAPPLPRPEVPAPAQEAAPFLAEALADVALPEPVPALSPVAPEVGAAPGMPAAPAVEADKALALLADPRPSRPEMPVTPVVARGVPEALPRRDAPTSPPPPATRPRPREAQAAEPPRADPAPTRSAAATPAQAPASSASQPAAQSGGQASGGEAGLERQWAARVQSRIARAQRYPAGESAEGTARVALTLGRDGRLHDVSLAASSGHPALDRAAVEAVQRAGRFPAAPAGLTGESFRFAVRVAFRKG